MNVLADASLPSLIEAFPPPFNLTTYHSQEELIKLLGHQDVLVCRSTLKVNKELLEKTDLSYVASASSGIDHLDQDYLRSRNIQIVDAKGSNATAVADYVIASIAYLESNNIPQGKKAGIIGLGHAGSKVAIRLEAAGYELHKYDPLKELQNPTFISCDQRELFNCDILCVHAQLHDTSPFPSLNLIDGDFLSQLKTGCIIINAARGGIINESALLTNKKHLIYCSDVYLNEPNIDPQIIDAAYLCTPHIAGHSLEAKTAAVIMLSEKIHQLEGISVPEFPKSVNSNRLDFSDNGKWQDQILKLYNPKLETDLLKNAEDTKAAFLLARKNHNFRHDFSVYFKTIKNTTSRGLLGI